MIAGVSLSALAQVRPTAAASGDNQSQESSQTNTAAPTAAPIKSKPALSPSLNLVAAQGQTAGTGEPSTDESTAEEKSAEQTPSKPAEGQGNEPKGADGEPLTQEEKAEVAKLQARDREVRAHEQAHMAAGAGVTGGATYSYQSGPDGKQYAVGGEVGVRATASGDNPRQQIAQLQQVARAALAPANPSGQDRAVAANARAQAAQIQAQLAKESLAKAQDALSGGADQAEEATDAGAPAESKKLLPELPEISLPKAGAGTSSIGGTSESDASDNGRSGAVQPAAATVVARPEKSSSNTTFGGSQGKDAGIGGLVAVYQQIGAASGGNSPKPLSPGIGGRIISLNT